MVHFDSHPDLACPNEDIPAAACFQPRRDWKITNFNANANFKKEEDSTSIDSGDEEEDENNCNYKNLYEMLDTSQGGIAEWILPLAIAGGLNRIHWIKNNDHCHQFQCGEYDYHVGAWWEKSKSPSNCNEDVDSDAGAGADVTNANAQIESFLDLPRDAVIKTSLMHPYYMDDDSFVRVEELEFAESLRLTVTDTALKNVHEKLHLVEDADTNADADADANAKNNTQEFDKMKLTTIVKEDFHTKNGVDVGNDCELPLLDPKLESDWILDVCLDYFFCSNPFIIELYEITRTTGKDIARLIILSVEQTKFRQMALEWDMEFFVHGDMNDTNINKRSEEEYQGEQYTSYLRQYTHLVRKLLKSILRIELEEKNGSKKCLLPGDNFPSSSLLDLQEYEDLYNLYVSPTQGKAIWDDFILTINNYKKEESLLKTNGKSISIQTLVETILNVMPNLTLPHFTGVDNIIVPSSGKEEEKNLSLSPVILTKVKEFGQFLRFEKWKKHDVDKNEQITPPMCITIARSTDDGFTPSAFAEILQEAVLHEIHDIYCGCSRNFPASSQIQYNSKSDCKLKIIFDYGEFEGSSLEALYHT